MRRLPSVLALFALCTIALANPIQPLDFVKALVFLGLVVLFVQAGVVLVEGTVYARWLPVQRGRAYAISLIANVASLLAGFMVGQLVSFLVALAHVEVAGIFVKGVVNVVVCLAVEIPIVLFMTRSVWRGDSSGKRRTTIRNTAFWTNLAVCGTLQAGLVVLLSMLKPGLPS